MIAFREGEKMLTLYRRHGLILAAELAPIILFAIVLIGVGVFAIEQIPDEIASLRILGLLGILFFLHLLWIALFVVLADFFLDVWVLTDQRVIAIEQKGLFARTVSEFDLSRIQDVTIEVHGIIPTMFNYGNLIARTASEHESFIFKQVGRPHEIKDALIQASTAQRNSALAAIAKHVQSNT
ncbi:MAG: PH domain-containing protein [Patescibacteria group bacterium]